MDKTGWDFNCIKNDNDQELKTNQGDDGSFALSQPHRGITSGTYQTNRGTTSLSQSTCEAEIGANQFNCGSSSIPQSNCEELLQPHREVTPGSSQSNGDSTSVLQSNREAKLGMDQSNCGLAPLPQSNCEASFQYHRETTTEKRQYNGGAKFSESQSNRGTPSQPHREMTSVTDDGKEDQIQDKVGSLPWIQSFGVLDGAGELMRQAWHGLRHVFSVRRCNEDAPVSKTFHLEEPELVKTGAPRYPLSLLSTNPVDLLVVERSSIANKPLQADQPSAWEEMVLITPLSKRPKVILESWDAEASYWKTGPSTKLHTERWNKLGYSTRMKLIRGVAIGGAIRQERLMIARVEFSCSDKWIWADIPFDPPIRPMSNLLTPPGLVPKCCYISEEVVIQGDSRTDPMPNKPGARIRTERGVRGLRLDEYCRGLGLSDSLSKCLPRGVAVRTTSLFHWEYISSSLMSAKPEPLSPLFLDHSFPMLSIEKPKNTLVNKSPFSWEPKDIHEGSKWFLTRLENLTEACKFFGDPEEAYKEGLERLEKHGMNYNSKGPDPKWLQLLWWEFPPEHWRDLRYGFKQNFLTTPESKLTPNAKMDGSGLAAAATFVEELISLGVVRDIQDGMTILSNAPLFVIQKEGQPGEWRVIADMLKGGQNEHIGADPCFMPRVNHILDEMYEGGYSAVVDLSKYFYNLPTHEEDRPHLGLMHPITEVLYAYCGQPMGSGNAPSVGCKVGLAFIRKLKEKFEVFNGKGRPNCFWTGFRETGYDPALGYGFILENRLGLTVKIWAFVDDFLIHGPNQASVESALGLFLDSALDVGFLAHPDKLISPSQEVKYCGFLFNTTGVPTLKIPVPKRERALAICEHLLFSAKDTNWSRLSLAVAAGVLESLSDATPRSMGHTKLRSFHHLVHPSGMGSGIDVYYTRTQLTEEVREELRWWRTYLLVGEGKQVRTTKAATLVPCFGDGSGTGTGGTFRLPDTLYQLMWSAVWHPFVWTYSSNWKELNTLKQTLLRLKEHGNPRAIRGTTVFYFTDNSTTYFICARGSSKWPRLHALISEIRLLEIELGISLQVIHIPGVIMIQQGTDGLSRGIWMSPLHSLMDEARLLQAIFDPVAFHQTLVWEHLPMGANRDWTYRKWNSNWDARECFHRLTIWCPPPELARQVITFVLNCWVECPTTTSALFFIPRTCSASWLGLSRYVVQAGTIYPSKTHLQYPPVLPIPIEILYLPPHVRSLPKILDRLDQVSSPFDAKKHEEEAAAMRGLQPRSIKE